MKILSIIISCLLLAGISCSKNSDTVTDNCTTVTITNSAPGCGNWGIVVNGTTYTSANIPAEFQQNGLTVCADYVLFEDLRTCFCCGGTWADIKSMKSLSQ